MTLRRRGSPVALRLWPSPAAKVDHTLNSQLSTLNYRLSAYSITSSSCVPSTSTLPLAMSSRPSSIPMVLLSVVCSLWSADSSPCELFIYDLDLLVDDLSGKPVDRNVDRIVLYAFHNEII